MPVELALFQPDIPQNTGTLLRLGACLGVRVHIIQPAGFALTDRQLKRAGLDYLSAAEMMDHPGFDTFEAWRRAHDRRLVLLTTRATDTVYTASFHAGDVLLMGRESAGVPPRVAEAADLALRIPMRPNQRSINVAVAASLVLGEALRQTGHFHTLG